MADTAVAVTAGTGTNIDTRTEATNGNHRQVVVLGDPSTNAGVAPVDATAGLKVDLGTDNDVTVTGTVTANLSATDNAVLDDIAADTESIKTAVETIDNAISGSEMQVDVVAALPAGTNNIGDVDIASIAAGDNNIGNVDVVTVPADPFGANADAAATAGSTGSIQAKLRLITSQLDSIKTAVETIDNTVGGSELQVDIVAALPAGTNAIGKLAANSGVDIGDVDVTSISAGTNLIGDVDIQPRTTGGWSVGNFTSGDTFTALTNTAQVIKGSAGKFGGYYIYNPNSSATYVLVYDVAAASVTVGTTTPKLVFCIPATAGANLELLAGVPFGTAMSIAATTTGGGNTAPSTALEVMIFYK